MIHVRCLDAIMQAVQYHTSLRPRSPIFINANINEAFFCLFRRGKNKSYLTERFVHKEVSGKPKLLEYNLNITYFIQRFKDKTAHCSFLTFELECLNTSVNSWPFHIYIKKNQQCSVCLMPFFIKCLKGTSAFINHLKAAKQFLSLQ